MKEQQEEHNRSTPVHTLPLTIVKFPLFFSLYCCFFCSKNGETEFFLRLVVVSRVTVLEIIIIINHTRKKGILSTLPEKGSIGV
jgi:hypothetical protein